MDTSDVCPTEDAIQTLLEHLVDPLLPAKSSVRDNPSESQQQLVAAQVHAVLLLYNYYHRKQHPHLKDGNFEWFCKLVVANKPALLAYMNFMQRSDDAKSEDLVKQFSITEKQIMDACDISKSLYALKGVPSTDWPISKVTVFLIDSSRKNCLLQFNSITQGVWSVIEKELGAMASKKLNKKKTTRKNPSRDELSSHEIDFQQLAFSAVEEATEISQTDLTILEGHVTYSLSEEKSTTCFYIMQCTLSKYDSRFVVPIKDVIDSLHGSLLQKSSLGWMVSAVVEYFHMLPYVGILSDWQSGIVSLNCFYSKVGLGNVNINDYKKTEKTCNIVHKDTCGFPGDSVMKEDTENKTVCAYTDPPENKDTDNGFTSHSSDSPKPDHMDVDRSEISVNMKSRVVESATRLSVTGVKSEEVAVGNKIFNTKTSDQMRVHKADSTPPGHKSNPIECKSVEVAVGMKTCNIKRSDQVQMHKADSGLVGHKPNPKDLNKPQTIQVLTKASDQGRMHKADSDLVCHLPNAKVLDKPQTTEVSKTCNIKTSDQGRMHKADSDLVFHQPNPKVLDKPQTIEVSKTCNIKTSDQGRMHKADSALVGHQPKPADCRSEKVVIGTPDQVQMHIADSALVGHQPKPADCRSEKVVIGTPDQVQMHIADSALVGHKPNNPNDLDKPQTNKVLTKASDQGQMHKADSALVCHQPNPKDLDKPQSIVVSTEDILSQSALKVHLRRRDKLVLDLRSIEDEIAQCDRSIHRILNGSKDDFALKIESILEGCTDVLSRNGFQERTYEITEDQGTPRYIKRKRLSEAVLSVQNPCQELDDICYKNNWILPTYRVSLSDGGFEAKANMKGIDFECSSEGWLCSSPCEARGSAAAQMLIKLRNMANSNPTP